MRATKIPRCATRILGRRRARPAPAGPLDARGDPAGREAARALGVPKGRIDAGEDPEATALREVAEETGAHGRSLGKLGDTRYVYTFRGERIFKVVSFYLVRYRGGRLGDVPAAFRHEIADTRWLPLDEAPRLLAYGGERDMAQKALARLADSDL